MGAVLPGKPQAFQQALGRQHLRDCGHRAPGDSPSPPAQPPCHPVLKSNNSPAPGSSPPGQACEAHFTEARAAQEPPRVLTGQGKSPGESTAGAAPHLQKCPGAAAPSPASKGCEELNSRTKEESPINQESLSVPFHHSSREAGSRSAR